MTALPHPGTDPSPGRPDHPPAAAEHPDDLLTAEDIAELLGMDIYAVRRLFQRGKIRGERRPPTRAWTTTRETYTAWLARQPDPTRYDLTAGQIATETGRSLVTVRGWFRYGGAPGDLVRAPNERSATWRTTRAAFDAWYAHRYPAAGHGATTRATSATPETHRADPAPAGPDDPHPTPPHTAA